MEAEVNLEKELIEELGIEAKESAEVVVAATVKAVFAYGVKKIESMKNPTLLLMLPFFPMVESILLKLVDKIDGVEGNVDAK